LPAVVRREVRVVHNTIPKEEQYPLSLTPDVLHSLQALALCRLLVDRKINIDINHGDVAWSSLEVKLKGYWISLPPKPTFPNI
jgi:hypothetical protein